jgi:hypothetical protein
VRGGHNRRPDEVKAREGTKRKDRTNPAAPKVDPASVPPPPKDLTAQQRAVWLELAAQVEELGIYAPSNLTAFRLLVQVVAEALHPDPDDPATARVRLAQVAAGLLQRFGLDPASRGRVSVTKPAEEDRAEDFLFGDPLRVVPGGKP